MKRNIISFIVSYLLLTITILITFLVSSSIPDADDYDVYCRDFKIDIELVDNGDANILFTLNTHINESYSVRYFSFDNHDESFTLDVNSLKINDEIFTKSNIRAPLEDMNPYMYYGQYYVGEVNNQYIIEYYFPRNINFDQKIELSFTMYDIVDVYNDVADLYYKIISDFDMPIYNINVNVKLPNSATIDPSNLYAYGYGPVDGVISENKTSFSAKNIDAGERFEIRLLMPNNLFNNAPRINKTILNDVIAENNRYKDITRIDGYLLYIAIIAASVIITYALIHAIKLKARFPRFKGVNQGSINRIPENIDPILAGKLIQFYKFDNYGDLFTASILNLAHKKVITLDDAGDKKNAVFTYTLNQEYQQELDKSERAVVNLLFKTISFNGKTLNDVDIEKYGKDHPDIFANTMKDIYKTYDDHFKAQNWVDQEMSKYEGLRFLPVFAGLIMVLVGIIINIIEPLFTNSLMFVILGIVSIFIGIIGVLIASNFRFRRLNQNGEDNYEEAKGFYDYLDNYTLIKEKVAADLVMWERYLVYAASFGIADKVIKQLEIKFKEVNDARLYSNSYIYVFYRFNSRGISSSNAIKTFGSSTFSPTRYTSSSGGGKGGFSGGGGGGHGGGGSGGR
jgi:uncharacterized membrane protein